MLKLSLASGSALILGTVALAAIPAVAAAHPAVPHATSCAHAHHHFAEALSGAKSGSVITVAAHKAKFHCGGEDDGHYSASKADETLTVKSDTVIKVFVHPNDPSKYKTIKSSDLPHYLHKNSSEPIYEISGHHSHITKMVEQFHP